MIRAHGSGACHGHTADDKIADGLWRLHHMGDSMSDLQLWSQLVAKCQNTNVTIMELPTSPRNRDTANQELSTVTEHLSKLNDMCAVETELDDTRHPDPEHCAHVKTTPQKDPFSQCENLQHLQGIHIQATNEYVGTLTTSEVTTRMQSDKHNNMFNVAANLKHVNTHKNNN